MTETSIQVGKQMICNRVVLQPMEGCDCNLDGSPSSLTVEKYIKAAKSGAGTVWFEANAVCPEGRINPRQMMLTKENLPSFRALLLKMRTIAKQECGIDPVFILQLTHSGRQSIVPMIAYRHPIYEERRPVTDENIVTDDYLDTLPKYYAESAKLAVEAGFDGVDVKSCHSYLFQELLSAFHRAAEHIAKASDMSRPMPHYTAPTIRYGESNLARLREELQAEMSRVADFDRSTVGMRVLLEKVECLCDRFFESSVIADPTKAAELFRLYDMVLTQRATLSAMLCSAEHLGTHGSALVDRKPNLCKSSPRQTRTLTRQGHPI